LSRTLSRTKFELDKVRDKVRVSIPWDCCDLDAQMARRFQLWNLLPD
jgi:hypothetical protein